MLKPTTNTSINHIEIGEASLIDNKLSFSVYINKSIKPGVTVIEAPIYPIDYEIRIKGNFIETETIANSYGTKSNLSLQSNELIQTTTKNGTKKISEYLANNIIHSYKNGKETAIIRCSINDYYNEDNSIAKSITDTTKDMTFRMYDSVIPMIPSPNGDIPMSKHKDGTSKIFKVLGTKLINNGAVWQELTLQERLREKYIKFEIDGNGTNTISARANTTSGTTTGISSNRTMQYSLNGIDWNSWDGSALTITTSQPIYLRSNITANGGSSLYTNFFFGNSTTKIKCSGDMRYMAMTNNYAKISNTVPFTYCYYCMFRDCTSLTTAPSLPATTLAGYCCRGMFYNCTSLTTAPSLPATTLAYYCYQFMFYNCTSLTTAPSLPATTLADYCYYYMFNSCTSLTTAPSLPATTLAGYCYSSMFRDCTSLTAITLYYGGEGSYFNDWVYGISTEGVLYKAGTQFASCGNSTYPCTWTQVQI